jgi:hypothetical protein
MYQLINPAMFALEHRGCRGSYSLPGEFEGAAPLDPANDEQKPPAAQHITFARSRDLSFLADPACNDHALAYQQCQRTIRQQGQPGSEQPAL